MNNNNNNNKDNDDYRAKIEDRAMDTIKSSINVVYDNLDINDALKKGREIYCMPNNFFVSYKIECSSNNINDLFVTSILKWNEIFLCNKKTLNQVVRNIITEKSASATIKLDKKYSSNWRYKIVEEKIVKKKNKQNYAHANLELYLANINVDVCNPKHIDQRLWQMIVAANFFGIPKNRVLKCKKNLLNAYFPTIDEALRIHINEFTSIDDIKYIWSTKVQKKQLAHRWGYGEKNINIYSKKKGKSKYINHDRDKMAFELKRDNPEITRRKIRRQLGISGFNVDFGDYYITVILRKYTKYINNGKSKIE
jgi:hypothetical protein